MKRGRRKYALRFAIEKLFFYFLTYNINRLVTIADSRLTISYCNGWLALNGIL